MTRAEELPPALAVFAGDLGSYFNFRCLSQRGPKGIYEAFYIPCSMAVILKVLLDDAPKLQHQRLPREKDALKQLEGSPHYPRFVELIQRDGASMLVMEKVEGTTLDKLIERQGPLPMNRAASLMRRICEALQPMHDRGLAHRDLKPEHVLMGNNGRLVILDLEFVRIPHYSETGTLELGLSLNCVFGTPPYMPPELFLTASLADARTDIFALGCMLWEMLTGRTPYDRERDLARLYARRRQPADLVTDRPIPADLTRVVAKAISPKPEDRYATIQELSAALEPFTHEVESGVSFSSAKTLALAPTFFDEDSITQRFTKPAPIEPTVVAQIPTQYDVMPVADMKRAPAAMKRRPLQVNLWMAVPSALCLLGVIPLLALGAWPQAIVLVFVGVSLALFSKSERATPSLPA